MATPPELQRITDYVFHYAERQPDQDALVLESQRWTYRQSAEQVDRFARALWAAKEVLAEAEGGR